MEPRVIPDAAGDLDTDYTPEGMAAACSNADLAAIVERYAEALERGQSLDASRSPNDPIVLREVAKRLLQPVGYVTPVACQNCTRRRGDADFDYSPVQVILGQPIGWYSGPDGEFCGDCMKGLLSMNPIERITQRNTNTPTE